MLVETAHNDNKDKHAKYRELNYAICDAMDSTKFGITLSKMVEQGMKPEMVAIFKAQFEGLQAAVRTENNRLTTWMPAPKVRLMRPCLTSVRSFSVAVIL